jgi:hypothetical protein
MSPDQLEIAASLGEVLRGAPIALIMLFALIGVVRENAWWVPGSFHRRLLADEQARTMRAEARAAEWQEAFLAVAPIAKEAVKMAAPDAAK